METGLLVWSNSSLQISVGPVLCRVLLHTFKSGEHLKECLLSLEVLVANVTPVLQ